MIALAAVILMVGCDKIEPEKRLISVGGDGTVDPWPEGSVVYVEKYTGPKCTNCPSADRTIAGLHEVYGHHMVVVSVNSYRDDFGAPIGSDPDMRVTAAQAWEESNGNPSLPAAYINRQSTVFSGSMSNLGGSIGEALASLPSVKVDVTATLSGNTVTINTNMELREAITESLTLTLLVTEDSLKYTQLDGPSHPSDYAHNHMLRAIVTDTWGKSINLGTTTGSTATDQTTYIIGTPAIVAANSHIVALVCDAATHRVMGCAQCDIR